MKTVLKFELKNNFKVILVSGITLFIIFLLSTFNEQKIMRTIGFSYFEYSPTDQIFFVVFIFSIITILLSFSHNKKREKSDLYFSLPVGKKELFLGKYLAVVIELISFILLLYIACYAIIVSSGVSYSFTFFLVSFILIIFSSLALFNFLLLFYYIANNYLDGIFYLGWALIAPTFVMACISKLISTQLQYLSIMGVLSSINTVTRLLLYKKDIYITEVALLVFILFIYFISILIVYHLAKKDSADKTETIGFMHKILIPVFYLSAVLYLSGFDLISDLLILVILSSLYYAFSVYFNRRLKIPKDEIIVFASSFIVSLVFQLINTR